MSPRFDSARFADYPLTVLAFHGTSRKVAEKILSGQSELKSSSHSWEWLGDGVYFWENAPERALRWAIEREKEEPTVIGAIIQVGRCLNLMDKSSNLPVIQAYERVSKLFDANRIPLPENNGKFHYRDAIVLNYVHRIAELNMATRTSTPFFLSTAGSAPTTSARPPVFTKGAHSDATNSTLRGGR